MAKPFNLEQAKAGKPVVTREGHPVRIISFDGHPDRPIVGFIGASTMPGTRKNNGRHTNSGVDHPFDYVMADPQPVKVKLWVNIRYDGQPWTYPTEKEAQNAANHAARYKLTGIKKYYRAVATPIEFEYLPEE